MIKVNLVPLDELESPFWYWPDLVMAFVLAAGSYFGVNYYVGTLQAKIDEANNHITSLTTNTAKMAPELERFKNLNRDIDDLNAKFGALKTITVSKIAKFKPLIVLEHLQNLRPEGVWYRSININAAADNTFEVSGQAFDNILTAELMTAMRSTASQDPDDADLRTQVYFPEISLREAQIPKSDSKKDSKSDLGPFPELGTYPEFAIKGRFGERSTPAQPAAMPAVADDKGGKGKGGAATAGKIKTSAGREADGASDATQGNAGSATPPGANGAGEALAPAATPVSAPPSEAL